MHRKPAHLARAAHPVNKHAARVIAIIARQQQHLDQLALDWPLDEAFECDVRDGLVAGRRGERVSWCPAGCEV